MGAYKLVIGCNFNQYVDGNFTPTSYFTFDIIGDRSVSSTSQIASQPMQNGETISDHMYRDPITMNVNGKFSLDGANWNDDSYNFINKGDRLSNVQHVFEKIKDEGILCQILTIDEDENKIEGNCRFKIRKNMALKSITWTEKYNMVGFDFSFYEIIMVNQQNYYNLPEEEQKYLNLPDVTYPQASSLGKQLDELGLLPNLIITSLYENDYLTDEYIKETRHLKWKYAGAAFLVMSGGVYVAAAAIGITSALVAAGATASVVPVGTIIAAVAVATGALIWGICKIAKAGKKKRKAKQLKKKFDRYVAKGELIKNADKFWNADIEKRLGMTKEEYKECLKTEAGKITLALGAFIDEVIVEVNKLNTNITIYKITENKPQQVYLKLDGKLYMIEFTKNNTTNDYTWEAKVDKCDDKSPLTIEHDFPVCTSFDELTPDHIWFRAGNIEVYILNPSLSNELNKTEDEMKNVKLKLDGYTIMVSDGPIQNEIKKIQNVIADTLIEEGFV